MYLMENEKVYQMDFSKVYHLLVSKAEKKGRTRQEVDEVARWLTGYSQAELEADKRRGLWCEGGRYRGASDAGDPLSG